MHNHSHNHHCHKCNAGKNILIAFFLNLFFSIIEIAGGIITGSVAIISDAIHDFGDAISIGCAYCLEIKSKKKADSQYTYGYQRYSVLGALITNIILIIGSGIVIYNAVNRFIYPVEINKDGMILFAIIGIIINGIALFVTKDKTSLNQKAVNLHMLEDVLGWIVVLIGSVIIKLTNISIIDPIMSICVALFILYNATIATKETIDIFLEKVPNHINVENIKNKITEIENVESVHDLHIWTIDGENNYATVHIVSNTDGYEIKKKVRKELGKFGVIHTTIQIEKPYEKCKEISQHMSAIDLFLEKHKCVNTKCKHFK